MQQDEGEYKGYKWVKCKCVDRAGQMWATVTLGRWLRALGSVYITLTDQAKTATRQKGTPRVRLYVRSLQNTQPSTVSIHLLRLSGRANHTPCTPAHGLKLIACFSQEVKGEGVYRVHSEVPCLRNSRSLYLLPAHTITLRVQGHRSRSWSLLNNTRTYLRSSLTASSPTAFWAQGGPQTSIILPRPITIFTTRSRSDRIHDRETHVITAY